MYLTALAGMLAESLAARQRHRQNAGHTGRVLPSGLDGLSDHHLRDIGYARERKSTLKHILWM